MYNKLFFITIFSLFVIACGSEDSNTLNQECQNNICKGDKRELNCPNQKPNNSYWEDVNKNGKIEQVYNGEKFIPEVYDCLWGCNDNYEKKGDICELLCDDGFENVNGECKIKCENGYQEVNGECKIINNDIDNDGVDDSIDNCRDLPNSEQNDINENGIGDACEIQDGSRLHPFIIDVNNPYNNSQNTQNSTNLEINSYPPNTLDESGPEYYYIFKLEQKSKVKAFIDDPEPDDTDIDIHILSSLTPLNLIDRGHHDVNVRLSEGVYYLVMDTYVDDGVVLSGNYNLTVLITPVLNNDDEFFNYYILEAIDYIDSHYRLLGYDSANLTHDIEYGDSDINLEGHYGTITRSGGARTMCVSAQMEIILTALQIYADDTGDYSVYDYLPKTSWTTQNSSNIKGHIWVNPEYSYGTGHALANFGMGIDNNTIEFEDLKPGSFINLNRTTGTGHGVTFLAFLDNDGNEYDAYPDSIEIIGFKYYSAQGGYDVGSGGMDYRWAIFSDYSTPSFCSSKRCDKNIIFSRRDNYLNVGMMWAPDYWDKTAPYYPGSRKSKPKLIKGKKVGDYYPADPKDWNGLTSYDLK